MLMSRAKSLNYDSGKALQDAAFIMNSLALDNQDQKSFLSMYVDTSIHPSIHPSIRRVCESEHGSSWFVRMCRQSSNVER